MVTLLTYSLLLSLRNARPSAPARSGSDATWTASVFPFGNMNTLAIPLNVPRTEAGKLASSTLVLADVLERVPPRSIGREAFVIGDWKVRPRVTASFGQDENLGVFLQAYNFIPEEGTRRLNGSVTFQIVPLGSAEKLLEVSEDVASLPYASPQQVTIEKLLPLRSCAPGPYTLKVIVTDHNSSQTVTSSAAFSVK